MESLGTEAREERLEAREERLEAREERLEAKERVEYRKEKRRIFISSRLVKAGLCKRFIWVRKKVPKASKDVLTFPCGSGILTKLFDGDEVRKLSCLRI